MRPFAINNEPTCSGIFRLFWRRSCHSYRYLCLWVHGFASGTAHLLTKKLFSGQVPLIRIEIERENLMRTVPCVGVIITMTE